MVQSTSRTEGDLSHPGNTRCVSGLSHGGGGESDLKYVHDASWVCLHMYLELPIVIGSLRTDVNIAPEVCTTKRLLTYPDPAELNLKIAVRL